MSEYKDHLQDLSEIRTMMERSTKFISLSGLSGVGAGIVALIGAYIAYQFLEAEGLYGNLRSREYKLVTMRQLYTLAGLAIGIMTVAGGVASFFSIRMAKRKGLPIWNKSAKRLMLNMLIPLTAGGIFCLLLAWHGYGAITAPATLVFYGLALYHAGQFTLVEIRYLGLSEVVLGLIGSTMLGYGLIFWVIGFGLLHIIYGIVMYLKYER